MRVKRQVVLKAQNRGVDRVARTCELRMRRWMAANTPELMRLMETGRYEEVKELLSEEGISVNVRVLLEAYAGYVGNQVLSEIPSSQVTDFNFMTAFYVAGMGSALAGYFERFSSEVSRSIETSVSEKLSVRDARQKLTSAGFNAILASDVTVEVRSLAAETAFIDSGVATAKEWVSLMLIETCKICAGLDGTIVPLGSPFPGGFMRPPVHRSCQCGLLPVF